MNYWHYIFSGLRIRSALAIPEWDVFAAADDGAPPEVEIGIMESPAAAAPNLITPVESRFEIPEVGHYWVRQGREILMAPAPGAGLQELRLFLLGTAWGALSYQRGILCLHASAVQLEDLGVAFCGVSGAGKSSACAWALQHGGRFIADDLCRFEIRPGVGPVVHASAPRLKLWSESVSQFALDGAILQRDHFRHDKYHVAAGAGAKLQPVALGAICLLEWGELGVTRLRGKAALTRLLAAATYRAEFLEPMGSTAQHWQRCLELVQSTPVFELRRGKNWDDMAPAMALLKHQLGGVANSESSEQAENSK